MKFIRLALVFGLAGWLAACGSKSVKETFTTDADGKQVLQSIEYEGADPDYALYAHTVARQTAPGPAVDTSHCKDDLCVVAVAALADRGRASNAPVIQPPRPKVSGWATAGNFLLKGLAIAAPAAVNWHQSDVSAESTQALYSMIGSMHAGTVSLGSRPTYSAGGNINTGTTTETNITDSYNDSSDHSTHDASVDVSGDGSAVGDGNELINGDNAGNSGNIGEGNRQDSDDDNSDPGDDCTGSDCSVEVPRDPDPGT